MHKLDDYIIIRIKYHLNVGSAVVFERSIHNLPSCAWQPGYRRPCRYGTCHSCHPCHCGPSYCGPCRCGPYRAYSSSCFHGPSYYGPSYCGRSYRRRSSYDLCNGCKTNKIFSNTIQYSSILIWCQSPKETNQAVQHSFVKKYEKTRTSNIKKPGSIGNQKEKLGIKRHLRHFEICGT